MATIMDWLPTHFQQLLRIGMIILVAMLIMHMIQRIVPRIREALADRQESTEDGKRIRTLSRVIDYALTIIVSTITGLLILDELGISVAPILGAAGVVGIAIGFGAQNLVKDYFAGFFLLLENQVRLGDVVEAAGKSGLVEEVTLRYLRLRDYSGNVHFIPNGNITIVTNMGMEFAYAVIDATVAYGEDVQRVIGMVREVGESMQADEAFKKKLLSDLEIAGVEAWTDQAVVIRCRFRVTPLDQWAVRREFLRRLRNSFDSEGIKVPFARMSLA